MKNLRRFIKTFVGTFILSFGTVFIIAACSDGGGGGGGGDNDSDTETQGSYHEFTIWSEKVGVDYDISIGLPPDYNDSNSPYPSIFILDADYVHQGVCLFDRYNGSKYDLEDYILIGINNTDRRETDYVPVNTCTPNGGGNDSFLEFLVSELVPHLDENYNIDPARRLLSGISHGGSFVFYTLFTDQGETFPLLLSIDASVYCWDASSLEQNFYSSNESLPVIFYSSGATLGEANSVRPVMQTIISRNYSGLSVKYDEFPGYHDTIGKRSFDACLEWIDIKLQEPSD